MNLRILNNEGWGKSFQLKKTVTLVGSDPGTDIQLSSPDIAPLQLQLIQIQSDSDVCTVYNFSGMVIVTCRNQTIPVSAQQSADLAAGDRIALGDYKLIIEADDQPETNTPVPPAGYSVRGKKSSRFFRFLIPIFILLIAIGSAFFFRPQIYTFNAEKTVIHKGEPINLEWQVSRFADALHLMGEKNEKIARNQNRITDHPSKTIVYSLTAENWLTRLIGLPVQKEISVLVIPDQPAIDLFETDQQTVRSGETAVLSWSVGDQADQAVLDTGNERIVLFRDQFKGGKTLTIREDTLISLHAENDSGSTVKSVFIRAENPLPELQKFIIWVQPSAGAAVRKVRGQTLSTPTPFLSDGSFVQVPLSDDVPEGFVSGTAIPQENSAYSSVYTEKYAELIPDDSQAEGYRVINYLPNRRLAAGEQILLEWKVDGVSSVRIDPLSDENLNPAGTQSCFLTGSMNFVLTGKNNRETRSFLLPIIAGDPEEHKAPVIDFFKGNPAAISGQGDVVLSWSVGGEWTWIQLFASDNSLTSEEAATQTPIPLPDRDSDPEHLLLQSPGILISDALHPAGFLTINVSKDTSFILKAWNGSLSASANVDVKVTKANPDPKPVSLEIRTILPTAAAYSVGETVTVYTDFPGLVSTDVYPTGMILIRDGTTSCTIQLPKNSCDLKFADSGSKKITARYPGDSTYQAAEAVKSPIIVHEKQVPELKITGLLPERTTYKIGETTEVYVDFSGEHFADYPPSGKIKVTDGYSTCLITAGSASSCRLSFINTAATRILAEYPGDAVYTAVRSDPVDVTIVEDSRIGTETVISGIMPALSEYEIGDSIDVYVNVTPDQQGEQFPTGTISVTDGYSSCTIDLGGKNYCRIKLINGLAFRIDADYSGDAIYAASVSDSYPIMISMVDIGASVQAMEYSGCEAYPPDPDPNHSITAQIDTSVSPAMKYFSVDESFLADGGFYLNVTLTAKSGQFGANPGNVSAKLCSKTDPSYCISAQPAAAVRDAFVLAKAAATLEFPVVQRAGNFYLEIEYSGDSVVYGMTKDSFDIRGINKGILILTPAGILDPVDETYREYGWDGLTASDLGQSDYIFDAYILKGGNQICPVRLDAAAFPSPKGFNLKVAVSPSVFGANQTDPAWQSELTANGYSSEIIARLQPNAMTWSPSACQWQNPAGFWQIRCSGVGIMEPSLITYAADEQDLNYAVRDSADPDRDSDIPIRVTIGKYLSAIDTGNLTQPLQADSVYWLNYRKDPFDMAVGQNCMESDGPAGIRTVSLFLLDSNGDVTDRVINLTPYVLSREQMDSAHKLTSIEAPVAISSTAGIGPISVLTPYYGFTASGEIIDFNQKAGIRNSGCNLVDATTITVTSAEGTLSGGIECDAVNHKKVGVTSSFCQLSFSPAADNLPVTVRYAGNSETAGSQTEIILDVGSPSVKSPLTMSNRMLIPEALVTPQQVTLIPSFLDSATGYPAYTPYVGETYTLQLQTGIELTGDTAVTANWPEIFSAGNLDREKSTCLNYVGSDPEQLTIPGSEFNDEGSNTFTCSIVFAVPVSLTGVQTMNFTLKPTGETEFFQMTPFSWSGLPLTVGKRNLTHLLTVANEGGVICTSLNPVCGIMYEGDIYQLTYQIPAYPDGSSEKVLAGVSTTEELGTGTVTWPGNWAEAVRTANLSGSAEGIENLCEIDPNGQTIFPLTPASGQNSYQVSCNFIAVKGLLEPQQSLQLTNNSTRFAFQDAAMILPKSLLEREVTLTPSLLLQLEPAADGPLTDGFVNHQISRLYRTNSPYPNSLVNPADIAEYTLTGTVTGIPSGRKPFANDRIAVKWSLLDALAQMGELPSCFIPDGSGIYQLGTLSAGEDGSWKTGCQLRFPSTMNVNTESGPLEMFLESDVYEESVSIQSAGSPFSPETVKAFITVPENPGILKTYPVDVDLNSALAPLSDYGKALLGSSPISPIIITWGHQDVLSCGTSMLLEEDFHAACTFRFDTIPANNSETRLDFSSEPSLFGDLLNIEMYSAVTAAPQSSFPVSPISKVKVTLQTGLYHNGTEMLLPATETDAFTLQDEYELRFTARFTDPGNPAADYDLSAASAEVSWPVMVNPALSGSCAAPSGMTALPFHFDELAGEWTAGCDFMINRGDLVLSEQDRLLTVDFNVPGFEIAFSPQEQPVRMPGSIRREQSVLTISPVYQTGEPGIIYPETVPTGADISVDVLFNGIAGSFNPDLLTMKAGSEVLTGCTNSGMAISCKIPSNCTDGAPLSGDIPYPEVCSDATTLSASYPGDMLNSPSETAAAGYRVVRQTMTFSIPPIGGFDTEAIKNIWQSAEDGQSWNVASVSSGDWDLDSYLVREVRSADPEPARKAYPVYITAAISGGTAQPDEALFFLDVVYKKSVNGIISEEEVSIKPRSYNPLDGSLTFMLDFGDLAILDDGTMVMDKFSQIMSIERITVRYAGDPFISTGSVDYQPGNLQYPLKVVTLAEQTLSATSDQLVFGGIIGAEAAGTSFDVYCSQPVYQLNCFSDPLAAAEAEPAANGCWGVVNTAGTGNPVITASPIIDPRCYLFGIRQSWSYDQLWLSDSRNEGL